MSYSSRTFRHRNPKAQENEQQTSGSSFFHTASKGVAQTKKEDTFFQAKLSLNQPGDEYEKEADAVAGSVMNSSGASGAGIRRKEINGIQRLSSSQEDEKLSTNEERMKKDKDIQRMPAATGGSSDSGSSSASPGVSSRVEQSSGSGRKLSGKVLAEMSQKFGMDFSDVTIHTDTESTELNKNLGAQAFTHGSDIFFDSGKYNPDTAQGKFLLAHELTHVVQQSGDDKQIQRMAACPARLKETDPVPPGWKPYYGDSSIFHCGFRGILEDRAPTPQDPMNECFYDHSGTLVDANHKYAGCAGTPDYFDSETQPWEHALIDPGGIWQSGWDAFLTSAEYTWDHRPDWVEDCKRVCDYYPWIIKDFCKIECTEISFFPFL